ncbi:unnamed protein product, partial [marine sediment metagenome]
MPTLFKNTVSVAALAANAEVTMNHGLNSEASGLMPSKIWPVEATRVIVVTATTTNITFKNNGPVTESVKFGVSWDRDMEKQGVTTYHVGFSPEVQTRMIAFTDPPAKNAT